MSLYAATVPQLSSMLDNLDLWLTAASSYAEKKSFDPNTLLAARLAPDQYPLVRQVQAACDAAKFAAARLGGKQPPVHPDTETTMDELHTRVRAVAAYLRSFTEADFAGAKSVVVPLSFLPGKGMLGPDYLNQMALPNFYFHATTAYAILRHNGVDLGKRDYIRDMTLRDL